MSILTNAEIAGKVRGLAAEKRVTNSDLAAFTHMSRMAMSRRMRGETPFTPEELSLVGEALHTPVSAFFGERVA